MHSPFRHRRALLTTLITTIIHGTAVAEEARLPTISVTASSLNDSQTLNSSIIDAEELMRLAPATSDTASLLSNVPGLNIQGSGGVSGLPVIHGLADDRLRIKVDGMDLISACGNHMNPALSYIDPTNVGRAAVFAGITPVSIGGDSIGGTILVDSADPVFSKDESLLTQGEIGASYRSNGNAQGANLGATVANEELSLSYRGSVTKAEDYKAGDDFKPAGPAADGRDSLDGDEVGSTMYKSINQSLALAMRNDEHLVELKFGVQDIPYQGWPNQRMDMTGNDSKQANLHYEGEYDWGFLEARVYHEKTRHKMQFFDDKLFWYGSADGVTYPEGEPCDPWVAGMQGCAAGMPMDTEGVNDGVVVKADIDLSAGELLRVGIETQQYRLDDWWEASGKGMAPNTFWNINNGERDRLAVFGEWEAQWSQQWLTLFGVRGEQVSMNAGEVQGYNTDAKYLVDATAFNAADRQITDNNIDLTALARFTPEDTRTIEFGYARKTRSPNLYERYTWSTGGMAMRMINWAGDGNGYVGSLDLEPEVAHTVSATLDWHDAAQEKMGLKVTPYYTYVDDYIDVIRCISAVNTNCGYSTKTGVDNATVTDEFVYLQFDNQTASLRGVDISGHYPLLDDTEYGSFSATGLVNYVRGKNEDTGDNLYNIMPLNAKLAVVQRVARWANTIELELVDAKTDVSQMRNEVQTSGYGLFHLRSSYGWKQLSLNFGIENLLDRFYNDPLGGVYFGQGKTMSGTDVPWGVAVPGMGRSIYVGANLKF